MCLGLYVCATEVATPRTTHSDATGKIMFLSNRFMRPLSSGRCRDPPILYLLRISGVYPIRDSDKIRTMKITPAVAFLAACAFLTAADAPTAVTFLNHDR